MIKAAMYTMKPNEAVFPHISPIHCYYLIIYKKQCSFCTTVVLLLECTLWEQIGIFSENDRAQWRWKLFQSGAGRGMKVQNIVWCRILDVAMQQWNRETSQRYLNFILPN